MARQREEKCSDIQKMFPPFINKELKHKELEHFMKHLENCDECMEELSIQFLVTTGLNSLESGNAFDLKKELMNALEDAKRETKMRLFIRQTLYILLMVGLVAGIMLGIMAVIL